jgi:hypothetical protein
VAQAPSAALTCPHSHYGDNFDGYEAWAGLGIHSGCGGNESLDSYGLYVFNCYQKPAIFAEGVYDNAVEGYSRRKYGVYGETDSQLNANALHGGVKGFYNDFNSFGYPGKGVIGETTSPGRWTAGVYANYNNTVGTGQAILTTVSSADAWAGWFNSQGHGLHIEAGTGKIGLEVSNGTKNAVVQTSEGSRLLYTEESTAVWFTDYGFGKLKQGEVLVPLNALFAETVNLNDPYHVFVQSYGNAELYVSERAPTHFKVKSRRGKPDTEFSYRIVAKRLGYERAYLDKSDHAKGDVHLVHKQGTNQYAQGEVPRPALKTGGQE